MIENVILPPDMRTVIGSESRDFAVKALRAHPLKLSLGLILFGLIWLAFTSVFFIAFLGPAFSGKEVHIEVNDVPAVAGPGNWGPLVGPAIIIGIFLVVGLLVFGSGIYLLTKKGGYFAGTPTRMVISEGGSIRSIDWEQFTGDIEIKGDSRKGNLTLQLRTGRMVSRKSGSEYVPETICITGIPDVFDVEKICRKRIKENDPTPSITSDDNS